MEISDYVKNKLIDSSCKGTCFNNPLECKYFGEPPQDLIDELGEDYDSSDNWYKMEDCPNLQVFKDSEKSDLEFELECAKAFITPFVDYWSNNKDLAIVFPEDTLFDYVLDFYMKGGDILSLSLKFLIEYSKNKITNNKRDEYVYMLLSDQGTKIGRSYEPKQRSRTIGTKTPFEIKETKIFKVSDMAKVEVGLHRKYKDFRMNGEWFNLSEDQIKKIENYLRVIEC